MVMDYYYHTDTKAQRAKLQGISKDLLESFGSFNSKVFAEGKLSVREKELIAVAVTHTTRCPYCIANHTAAAKKAGATEEEIAEAIFVAAALNAGAALAHSNISMQILAKI